ncbi:MAG: hypothetical protein IKS76_01740 [Paludibacteraceae bacterium]|nr:hypothetical protein [Paludibacteraceae bacterium]
MRKYFPSSANCWAMGVHWSSGSRDMAADAPVAPAVSFKTLSIWVSIMSIVCT